MNINFIFVFVISFVLCFILTPFCIRLARRWKVFDKPDHKVKRHARPVPYLGGLAIAVACLLPLLFCLSSLPAAARERLTGIIIGSAVVMVVGLLDDLWSFKPLVKLLAQLAAAVILVFFGVRLECLDMSALSITLTILWLVGMANAFNFIDIMDGLAGGVACIAALAFLAISLPGQDAHVLLASAAVAGSTLAFLRYNFQPAKIFMGDAGSQFLGFFLAAVALGASYTQSTNIALFVPVLILGVPIFDTALVIILRTLRGVPFFLGSDDHLALRLRRRGLSVPQVVLVLYVVSGLLGASAVLITRLTTERAMFVYVCLGMVLLVVGHIVAEIPTKDKRK